MRFATPLLLAALASVGLAQTTTRVSVSSAGVEANGPTTAVTISESGRWVAMQSAATNLVAGDTNGVDDIFLHDRNWATTTRASVATGGAGANGSCALPSISGNGQLVAFESTAMNLAAGYGPVSQVYVHDRVAGTTVAASPVAGNGASSECAISLDGNWVVFHSSATNLVAGDTNGAADVFLCDLAGGTISRVSVSSGGTAGNGPSTKASVSADGRYVTFVSSAANLVAGDGNGVEDVFLRDTQTGITTRVSLGSAGTEGNGAAVAGAISPDGGYVAFASDATNLVFGDTNGARDIFVKVLSSGITVRASVSSAGVQANGGSFSPGISWYGSEVSFHSLASNLVPGLDTNGARDVFKHDLDTGATTLISADPSGIAAAGTSWLADLDTGGRVVAFQSDAANLVTGDTNGVSDAFVQLKKATWYIDVDRTAPGVGTPGAPFTSIQYAIDQPQVVGGDELLVAEGTYSENLDLRGKSVRIQSISGKGLTTMTGGGAGRVITTVSGEGPGTEIRGFTITDGSYVATTHAGWGAGIICIGSSITVTDCDVVDNGYTGSGNGGGIYAESSLLTLDQITIARNRAYDQGGGVWMNDCVATFSQTTIREHRETLYGAGIYALGASALTMHGCYIEDNGEPLFNSSWAVGAGIYIDSGSLTVNSCSFNRNGGNFGVGGAIMALGASLIIDNSTFEENTGTGGAVSASGSEVVISNTAIRKNYTMVGTGGGLDLYNCVTVIRGSTFFQNIPGFDAWDGGGLSAVGGSLLMQSTVLEENIAWHGAGVKLSSVEATIEDTEFKRNRCFFSIAPTPGYGAAIAVEGDGSVSLRRCVFFNNYSSDHPTDGESVYGLMSLENCTAFSTSPSYASGVSGAFLANCIVDLSTGIELAGGSTAIYSNIDGGASGLGNIDADSLFWDPDGGDFHLKLGSPCIDAGDPSSPLDPDGSIADMGAFPFDPNYCPPVTNYCTAGTTANGCNALISATGTASATASSGFDVAVTGLEGQKDGIIFWGKDSQASPWGGGTSYLCIEPPVKRTGTQSSGGTTGACDGAFALDFNAWMAAYPNKAPAVGDVVYMQAWFRDPPSPKGTSLSDGLRLVVCP